MDNETAIINKKNIGNIVKVALVSLLTLCASLLSGFIIPKILSVENYGYYQTVLLYVAYIGLIPLGFFDGIILTYAGKSTEELPKNLFHFFWWAMFFYHLILAILFITVGLLFFPGFEKWIFIYLGLQIFFANLGTFFANIATITSNFKTLNRTTCAGSVFRIVVLGTITLIYFLKREWLSDPPFYWFLGISLMPFILIFVIYLIKYRHLVFGRSFLSAKEKRDVTLSLLRVGIPLLISNLLITFILESDRQFVQIAFDVSTYAVYAFAYSVLALINKVVFSISTVLFPELKKRDSETALSQYPELIGAFVLIVSLCSFGYFAIQGIVLYWLPKYTDSLPIFRVILAAYLCYSSTVIINLNYYKANLWNARFLIISLCALALAIGLNFAAFYLFHTTYAISVATLITLLIWFTATSIPLSKKIRFKDWKNYVFVYLFAIGFTLCSFCELWLDAILSVALFILLVLLFQRNIVVHLIQRIKSIKKPS